MGSYLHGIFEQQQACQYLLKWAGLEQAKAFDYLALQQQGIDLMADTLDEALDVDAIMKILSV
jgi:adenosylcobyric acid synthase